MASPVDIVQILHIYDLLHSYATNVLTAKQLQQIIGWLHLCVVEQHSKWNVGLLFW